MSHKEYVCRLPLLIILSVFTNALTDNRFLCSYFDSGADSPRRQVPFDGVEVGSRPFEVARSVEGSVSVFNAAGGRPDWVIIRGMLPSESPLPLRPH